MVVSGERVGEVGLRLRSLPLVPACEERLAATSLPPIRSRRGKGFGAAHRRARHRRFAGVPVKSVTEGAAQRGSTGAPAYRAGALPGWQDRWPRMAEASLNNQSPFTLRGAPDDSIP